ncbi:hypothetical protein [Chitinophaga sp. CF418]|uniref:hypothetical protein n=1 Tax=Chitinophaga sp. CF418 TaxID=1855287 RepID=UPI000913C53C|nr:hypothetical protein [Chitinophaga sp. CF418]SHN36720.1 hypothetical protein SAMN05216311_110133 [Chitinophaga sp. CF418]
MILKKIFLVLCAGMAVAHSYAQENEGTTLDLLKAPSSPASNLLGFATTDVDKPTDISSLMMSLQSASGSFMKLPSSYAIDLAPYFLLNKVGGSTTDLNSKKYGDVFRQTFVLSVAIRNPDSTAGDFVSSSTYAGIGFKFSLKRPKYNAKTEAVLDKIHDLQQKMNKRNLTLLRELEKDSELIVLRNKLEELAKDAARTGHLERLNDTSSEFHKTEEKILQKRREKDAADSANNKETETAESKQAIADDLQRAAASFDGARSGLSWELAGGISGEFLNKQFNSSRMHNAGIWTTLGYTGKQGLAILGLVRFLHNPEKIFAKDNELNKMGSISTLDGGARGVYSPNGGRFNCSVEAVYRSVLSSNTIDPSWRLIFNADYSIFRNQKLTFSFGRNFDGVITKDGNLVAALTLIAGLGNKR